MSDIVKRLRGAADAAARTLSENSMMPPEMSGLGDAEAEDLVFLCRDASDRIEALEAALEPFADFGELMEVETEGFSDTDRLELVPEESDVRIGEVFVGAFRRARATSLEQRLRDAGVE